LTTALRCCRFPADREYLSHSTVCGVCGEDIDRLHRNPTLASVSSAFVRLYPDYERTEEEKKKVIVVLFLSAFYVPAVVVGVTL
jgi:hypothetical protein